MAGLHSKISQSITIAVAVVIAALAINPLSGQDTSVVDRAPNAEDLGDQGLNTQVIELVKENKFLRARPYLLEMKKRIKEDPDENTMEAISFFLASSYLQEYQETENKDVLQTAVTAFKEYIDKYPSGPRKTVARLNLGDAYSDLKEYNKAIEVYDAIYKSPTTDGSVRNEIRSVIAKTYLKTDKPERGMPYFFEAYERAVLNEEARAQAATWLLQAYLSKGEIEKIRPYFQHLTGKKAALYNPKFNVTLIKAGDDLFEEGNFDFAILFYEIVKDRDEIVSFYEDAVTNLRLALSYREKGSDGAISTEKRLREAEANLKAVRGIRDYDADVRWRSARVLLESERTWEALWSFYNLMLDYPTHEQAEEFLFLAFSQARKVNDYYMVVKLAKDYLARKDYKKYRGQVILDLATYYQEYGYHDEFYQLAVNYLEEEEDKIDNVAAQLANLLAIHLMERERFAELYNRMYRYNKALVDLSSTFESTGYWKSLALLLMADYSRALDSFNEFLNKYSDRSMFSEDAYYRRAICLYGVQRADEAYEKFTAFVERYPTSTRRGEAELYRGDIMREKGELDTALGHYRLVDEFTDRLAFITKAVFAISEVLEVKGKYEEAAQTLLAYIDDYGDEAELGKAYLKLGNFEERQRNISGRFRYHVLGLEATANNPYRYAADEILQKYKDYPQYVKNFESAIDLIDAMLADSDYLTNIMKDRALQYQFFESGEGKRVDPYLVEKIVRDRAFRKNLLDSPEEILQELRSEYSSKLEGLADYKPELVFSRLLSKANDPKTVLKLRIAMARQIITGNDALFNFTQEQVQNASPAVMLWRARNLMTLNPAKANALLEVSLEKHPYAPNRYDTMLTKAEIAANRARSNPSEANWEAALAEYNQIIERFGMRPDDGVPFLAKGEILIQLGREKDALSVLSDVLRNPEWRGKPQAKAHLQLGIAHYNMQNYAEAHGFFERLMLGFGGFQDEVALAYYWDLKTLESMNETESKNQLLTEIRTRDDLKETAGYRLIEENYAL